MEQRPVCLSVGGSDSCGGAGIQADLRVFEALEVQGCSAISALTAQNPSEIKQVQPASIAQFQAELRAILDYYPVQSIKTGMLYDEQHLLSLVEVLSTASYASLIVDPVLISSSGTHLFESENTIDAYHQLISCATLWTPNLQEAAFFIDDEIQDPIDTASALLLMFKVPVLLKGGHGEGEIFRDIFCDVDGSVEIFEHPKKHISSAQSHGTGCRLASAIAANLAHKNDLLTSIKDAQHWMQANL